MKKPTVSLPRNPNLPTIALGWHIERTANKKISPEWSGETDNKSPTLAAPPLCFLLGPCGSFSAKAIQFLEMGLPRILPHNQRQSRRLTNAQRLLPFLPTNYCTMARPHKLQAPPTSAPVQTTGVASPLQLLLQNTGAIALPLPVLGLAIQLLVGGWGEGGGRGGGGGAMIGTEWKAITLEWNCFQTLFPPPPPKVLATSDKPPSSPTPAVSLLRQRATGSETGSSASGCSAATTLSFLRRRLRNGFVCLFHCLT